MDKTTLSTQIVEEIKQRILDNTWKENEKLPSEKELSEEFQVNRLTVRIAINKLNALGLLETRTGEGTFVRKLNIYNYINQIIPFILSNHEISNILDFEKQLIFLATSSSFNKDQKKKINEILEQTSKDINFMENYYTYYNKYPDEIVEKIAYNYLEAKIIFIEKNVNNILVTIYKSLDKVLIDNDLNYIRDCSQANLNKLEQRINDLIKLM